jgi:hypothetical protein
MQLFICLPQFLLSRETGGASALRDAITMRNLQITLA